MDSEKFLIGFLGVMIILILILILISGIFAVYDLAYLSPRAAEKANNHCIAVGYDTYESYVRIGLLSDDPVAIKCKYVENRRMIDMNLNKRGVVGDGAVYD